MWLYAAPEVAAVLFLLAIFGPRVFEWLCYALIAFFVLMVVGAFGAFVYAIYLGIAYHDTTAWAYVGLGVVLIVIVGFMVSDFSDDD